MEQNNANTQACITIHEEHQENSVMRFLFENHGVRGEILHIREPVQRLLQNHNYPKSVQALMLELASASVLMAATLKANGTVTVQMQGGEGDKALRFAFVNIDKDLNFYGCASLIEGHDYTEASFKDLVGQGGILVISVFPEDGTRYQGIVSLDKDNLSAALEDYFKDSEQLATSMFIHSNVNSCEAGGLMLQIIPNIENNHESLEHLSTLSATLSSNELFELSLHESLRRLFWNDQVRVFEAEQTQFKCICSRERCLDSLKALTKQDLEEMAQDIEGTTMTCHNCGSTYHFTQAELQELLKS